MSEAIDIDVSAPDLAIQIGPVSIDPVKQALGHPIEYFLESLLRRRPEPSIRAGVKVVRYPLRLPSGEGVSIPLGSFGEVGFQNVDGELVLTVPPQSEAAMRRQIGDALVESRVARGSDGAAVVEMRVSLRPGARFAWGLPLALGEIAVEVP